VSRFFVLALMMVLGLVACGPEEPEAPESYDAGDSLHHGSHLTPEQEEQALELHDSLLQAAVDSFPQPKGRVVSIMITGLDSRIGDRGGRADANHVVRLYLDAGQVEVISIPRDTEADAGFKADTTDDSVVVPSTLNKLANVRSNRGRTTYLSEVCRIAGIPKIDYWVEFGFSQAIGLIELMGGSPQQTVESADGSSGGSTGTSAGSSSSSSTSRATQTLRVLRSRKSFSLGDYQRVFNQGQYVRRGVLYGMQHVDEVAGGLALRAALLLVETNLTYAVCQSLAQQLRAGGFDGSAERVWVRLKPVAIRNLQAVSFSAGSMDSLYRRIDAIPVEAPATDSLDSLQHQPAVSVTQRLGRLIEKAAADSAKRPLNVIHTLQRPFEQRAWLQITDPKQRRRIRERCGALLAAAYDRVGKGEQAKKVRQYVLDEQSLIEGR
jgi:anionic cell wall polymer biosynthesis LytR-Cps2A-Psr (LCP) family protein